METLNFTQFCIKYGYPCDYDTMFESQLLGSRGLAGNVSKQAVKSQDDNFHDMQRQNKEAHTLFYNAVKNGEILDGSGKLTQSGILAHEQRIKSEQIKSELQILQGKIKFIESLGNMSHLKNGKLKKGYQMQVDEYNEQIKRLNDEKIH